MLYQPANRRFWDPSVLWLDGSYYTFYMHGTTVGLAISSDGVHWTERGPVIKDPDEMRVCKCFVSRIEDRFVLNYGSFTDFFLPDHRWNPARKQNRLRFFESDDLTNWRFLYDMYPD